MKTIKKLFSTALLAGAFLFTSSVRAQSGGDFMTIMHQGMQDMQNMQTTGDPDNDFAMMLRRHHEAAIAMANIEVSNGKDAQLKALAKKMIAEQTKDNKELDVFLSSHTAHSNSDFGQTAKTMMSQSSMNMNMSGDVDKDFAMMMTEHHSDGIKMAREYLKSGKEQKMIKMANKNIASQTQDIKKMSAKAGGSGKAATSGQHSHSGGHQH